MPYRGRVATIAGAALLGAAASLVAALPAQAAPTATAWVTSGAILYEAASGQANAVTTAKAFTASGALRWQITDAVRITPGAGCSYPSRTAVNVVWCEPGTALLIAIRTFDLNDTVTIGSPSTVVYAGGGDDTVSTMDDPSVVSIVYGEDGADTVVSGASRDSLDGGPGLDTVSYQHRLGPMCGDLFGWASPPGGGPLAGACEVDDREDRYLNGSIENLTGGAGDDVFFGTTATNRFEGGAGDDEVHTGGGDDTVYGGAGDDDLSSGSGSNYLNGGAGNDRITDYGLPGELDVLDGGPGLDTCVGWKIEVMQSCELPLP